MNKNLSLFSGIFGGRWEESIQRDGQGRIFLDHDPELLEIIINFMRAKRIENPSKPLAPPKPPSEKKELFGCLLAYFGLESLFILTPPAFLKEFQVHEPNGSQVSVAETGFGQELTYNGPHNYHFLCLAEPVICGDFWKITIQHLPYNCWLYLGLIKNMQATKDSYVDMSSFGWK